VDPVRVNDIAPSAAPPSAAAAPGAELTLGELLHSVAYTRLPTQFYALLQLAIPAAAELWSIGMYRSAGWMTLASLYGIWALSAKRLDETYTEAPPPAWLRATRALSRTLGGALGGVLVIDVFIRGLSLALHCPGCAG